MYWVRLREEVHVTSIVAHWAFFPLHSLFPHFFHLVCSVNSFSTVLQWSCQHFYNGVLWGIFVFLATWDFFVALFATGTNWQHTVLLHYNHTLFICGADQDVVNFNYGHFHPTDLDKNIIAQGILASCSTLFWFSSPQSQGLLSSNESYVLPAQYLNAQR